MGIFVVVTACLRHRDASDLVVSTLFRRADDLNMSGTAGWVFPCRYRRAAAVCVGLRLLGADLGPAVCISFCRQPIIRSVRAQLPRAGDIGIKF